MFYSGIFNSADVRTQFSRLSRWTQFYKRKFCKRECDQETIFDNRGLKTAVRGLWRSPAIGEILTKGWVETAIPFFAFVATALFFSFTLNGYLTASNIVGLLREFSELFFVATAMGLAVISGGIDLSVGAIFALCNIVALYLINVSHWPAPIVILAVVLLGGVAGSVNGALVGLLRVKAFISTLATLILFRSLVEKIQLKQAVTIAGGTANSKIWDWMSDGSVLGIPSSAVFFLVLFAFGHFFLTRTRPGWRIAAIGGSSRASYNAGINIRLTIFFVYVAVGALVGVGALFTAARLDSAGESVGAGLEVLALTAVVLGGVALGGGRGSMAKIIWGTAAIYLLTNGFVRLGFRGDITSLIIGLILIAAVILDSKWSKWIKARGSLLANVYVNPAHLDLPLKPLTEERSASVYALNDKLRSVEAIALGQVEGPEDVILDEQDNIYCGVRTGDILRVPHDNLDRVEVFAHLGGYPLGLAFDRKGDLIVCVAGMGLYGVQPDGTTYKLTDETDRSRLSISDNGRIRLADDLDIAPDGRIFFSEATVRYEMHSWDLDGLEGRGNGRIICFDPSSGKTRTVLKDLVFPNGICMSIDGQSFFFAETWACRISRYWFAGPRAGQSEIVIGDLPGYPDNINRASDGTYWLALAGMRGPVFDLAMKMPEFRRRMVKRIAKDEWLSANINSGCVVKFDEKGAILDVLWDSGGHGHPMVTSMREHKGWLYLSGLSSNRLGRYRIAGADSEWTSIRSYWGEVLGV